MMLWDPFCYFSPLLKFLIEPMMLACKHLRFCVLKMHILPILIYIAAVKWVDILTLTPKMT